MTSHSIPPILAVNDLSKRFSWKRKPAIDGLNFAVYPGEFHAFIGANGAGKTTTIKCIIGAYVRHGGQILINGLKNTDAAAKALVGYIPEYTKFPAHFTARQYLLTLAEISGSSRSAARTRVDELLTMFHLMPLAESSPNRFSSGQKKKVVLIQALLANPKLLIMDEPTANLDPQARIEFFDILKTLQKTGSSFFVSTHILSEVSDYADALTILDGGKIALTGKIAEILAAHHGQCLVYDVYTRSPDLARTVLMRMGLKIVSSAAAPFAVCVNNENHATSVLATLAKAPVGLSAFSLQRKSLDDIYREYVRIGSVHTAENNVST